MIWMDVDTALASVPVNAMPLISSTDFVTIQDAVVYNQAGLALFWNFTTTAGVTTVTAITPTTSGDYDWTDFTTSGMYGIEIPASGGASINNDTEGFGHFTGVATGILPWAGPIIGFRAAALNNSLIDAGTTGLLAPTTAARTLDVSANGNAGIDWANIDAPTTAQDLSATTIDVTQIVATVSGNVNGDIGGSLVGSVQGNVDGNVAGDLGGDVVGNVQGNVNGSVGSVTGDVAGNLVGDIGGLSVGAAADFFLVNSGQTYGTAIAGSVVKEIADNATVTGTPNVNVTQISGDSVAADNLETMLDGTGGQTLSLGKLAVVAATGDAVVVSTAGGNGNGFNISGNGSGHGVRSIGGATGSGVVGIGGATSGSGIAGVGQTNAAGMSLLGNGTGPGLSCTGGATGSGAEISAGGGTGKYGIDAVGSGAGGAGIGAFCAGTGNGYGIAAVGLNDGAGMLVSGDGAGNAQGMSIVGTGNEAGLGVNGGATGVGAQIFGGATSGDGMNIGALGSSGIGLSVFATGNANGVEVFGSGSGDGVHSEGGATGSGINAIGGGTSGDGVKATAAVGLDINAPNSDIGGIHVVEMTAAALADFFTVDSGETYASAVAGSVVKEIADNATITTPVDANVVSIANNVVTAASISTDAIDADALATDAVNKLADGILGRNVAGGSSVGRTVSQALYMLRNKWTVASGTLTVYETDDATPSWTAAVSSDAAAEPIIGNDPS